MGGGRFSARLFLDRDDQVPFCQRERLLDSLGNTNPEAALFRSRFRVPRSAFLQPVDDDLDVVLDAFVELQVVGQLHDPTIDASANVPLFHHVGEEILELALLARGPQGRG